MSQVNFFSQHQKIQSSVNKSFFSSKSNQTIVSLYHSLSLDLKRNAQKNYEALSLEFAAKFSDKGDAGTRGMHLLSLSRIHMDIALQEYHEKFIVPHENVHTSDVFARKALYEFNSKKEFSMCQTICSDMATQLEKLEYIDDAIMWWKDAFVFASMQGKSMILQQVALQRIEELLLKQNDMESIVEIIRWRIRILDETDVKRHFEIHLSLVLALLGLKAEEQIQEALEMCKKYALMHELSIMSDTIVPLVDDLVDACLKNKHESIRIVSAELSEALPINQIKLLYYIEKVYFHPIYLKLDNPIQVDDLS